MLLFSGIIYVLFADSRLQSWNSNNYNKNATETELESLKPKEVLVEKILDEKEYNVEENKK